jgi:proteasome lid subunit RPN8/RPN11
VKEWTRPERTAPRPETGPDLPWRLEVPAESLPRLYIHTEVVATIARRAHEGALRRHEDLGLLIGDWARDLEGEVYAVAREMPTGPLETSPVSVRFKPEGLTQVARELDGQEMPYVVVGWYHTHLDLGVFMSDRDMQTQRGGFPHAHQVAVVVDPMRDLAGAFANGPKGPGTEPCIMASYQTWE